MEDVGAPSAVAIIICFAAPLFVGRGKKYGHTDWDKKMEEAGFRKKFINGNRYRRKALVLKRGHFYSHTFASPKDYLYICGRRHMIWPFMVFQTEIVLRPRTRGFHLVTEEIVRQMPTLPRTGIVNIFTKHTSCGLTINENCDPDVRGDMEVIFNRLVPEGRSEYVHTLEGADDMPAHAKAVISGVSLVIPITDGRLALGTWQGIYLCEYRNHGGPRKLVVTIIGE